ncbi:MAG: hypothetical protein WAO24_05355 [Peptococcia bacterium]
MSSKKDSKKKSCALSSLESQDRFKYEVAQEMGLSNRNKLANKSKKAFENNK